MSTITNRGADSYSGGGVSQDYVHEYTRTVGQPTEIPFTLAAAGADTIVWQSTTSLVSAWELLKLLVDPAGSDSSDLDLQVGVRVGPTGADSGTELWFTINRTEPFKLAKQAAGTASGTLTDGVNRIRVRNTNTANPVSGVLVLFPAAT